MKRILCIVVLCLAWTVAPAFSHHAAEGIVDEEIYEMIDTMVANTPHADMTLEDLGGMIEITVSTQTVKSLEVMIDDGLLTYFAMLDGEVVINITFDEKGGVTLTATQIE